MYACRSDLNRGILDRSCLPLNTLCHEKLETDHEKLGTLENNHWKVQQPQDASPLTIDVTKDQDLDPRPCSNIEHLSVLGHEMMSIEPGVKPSRKLTWKPTAWIRHIMCRSHDDHLPMPVWEVWFWSTLGVQIPTSVENPRSCVCQHFDIYGDHLQTCHHTRLRQQLTMNEVTLKLANTLCYHEDKITLSTSSVATDGLYNDLGYLLDRYCWIIQWPTTGLDALISTQMESSRIVSDQLEHLSLMVL